MEKKYFKYLVSAIFVAIFSLSIAYAPNILHLINSSGINQRLTAPSRADSLIVINLNKEAFAMRLSDPFKTITMANRALDLAISINYKPGIAEAYRVIGIGFNYSDNNALAVKNYIYALHYFTILGNYKQISRVYNNIGNLYKNVDRKKALHYYGKALKIAKDIKNEELIAGVYFNLAYVYGVWDGRKALLNFDKSFEIFKKLKDTISMIGYYQNTGNIHAKLRQFDEAKFRLLKAIEVGKARKMHKSVGACYLSIAYVYLGSEEYNLVEESIAEGMKYSQSKNNLDINNDFLRLKYELARKLKNYKKALDYLLLVYHNDSLLLNKSRTSNIDYNSQYYTQKQKLQEKELIITKQKYQATKLQLIIALIALACLILFVMGSIWFLWKLKIRRRAERKRQSEKASLEQKALQALMNPHFVFNVMNAIQYFLNDNNADMARETLSSFAKLARTHLDICMSNTVTVYMELEYLRLYLSLEKVRFPDKVNYHITTDEDVDLDEIVIPSMLIQPFVENAILHGIVPKEEGGTVRLYLRMDDNDFVISIIDDGVGIMNSEKSKKGHVSRGMDLIRERVKLLNQLNKRPILITQQQTGDFGTSVVIRIPA